MQRAEDHASARTSAPQDAPAPRSRPSSSIDSKSGGPDERTGDRAANRRLGLAQRQTEDSPSARVESCSASAVQSTSRKRDAPRRASLADGVAADRPWRRPRRRRHGRRGRRSPPCGDLAEGGDALLHEGRDSLEERAVELGLGPGRLAVARAPLARPRRDPRRRALDELLRAERAQVLTVHVRRASSRRRRPASARRLRDGTARSSVARGTISSSPRGLQPSSAR